MKMHAKKIFVLAAAAVMVGGLSAVFLTQPAAAKPEFTAQTKKACGQCHENPGGGGKLKPYGEAFKANGFKLPQGK